MFGHHHHYRSPTHLIRFSSWPCSSLASEDPASWLTLASSRTIWLCFASRQSFSVWIWPAWDSSSDIIKLVSLDTSSTSSEIWNQKHISSGWVRATHEQRHVHLIRYYYIIIHNHLLGHNYIPQNTFLTSSPGPGKLFSKLMLSFALQIL